MQNLVKITEKDFGVILDVRYATINNVCEHKLYSEAICYLHKDAVELLKKVIEEAGKLGFKLKIFDCFRPIEVQKYMFKKFSSNDPHGGFISDPKSGSIPHCRGVAIDLTLTDLQGKELNMGTDFDEFSDLAFHSCNKVSPEAVRNRLILFKLMKDAGFDFYSKEWWHYQLFNPREYPVVKTPKGMSVV